jgi:hypothetical protein
MPGRADVADLPRAGVAFFDAISARIIIDNLMSGFLHPDLYDPRSISATPSWPTFGVLIDTARPTPKDKPPVDAGFRS